MCFNYICVVIKHGNLNSDINKYGVFKYENYNNKVVFLRCTTDAKLKKFWEASENY